MRETDGTASTLVCEASVVSVSYAANSLCLRPKNSHYTSTEAKKVSNQTVFVTLQFMAFNEASYIPTTIRVPFELYHDLHKTPPGTNIEISLFHFEKTYSFLYRVLRKKCLHPVASRFVIVSYASGIYCTYSVQVQINEESNSGDSPSKRKTNLKYLKILTK